MSDSPKLTRAGVLLSKKQLGPDRWKQLKKELTVKPHMPSGYGDQVEPYEVFVRHKSRVWIPRYFAGDRFDTPIESERMKPTECPKLKFLGSMRPLQEEVIAECLPRIRDEGGGLISLPCGYGKTVVALKLACELGLKTLVIVHKTFLQNQWYERIEQFTNARVGLIRQRKTDVENKDIVVGMLQSISMIDYDPSIFDGFGLVIIDEAHHVAARVFSQALQKTGFRHTIGLSATLERKDRMTKVIHWYLGPKLYSIERETSRHVSVKVFRYRSTEKQFREYRRWFAGKIRPDLQKMTGAICTLEPRNRFVADVIIELLKLDRKILLLSARILHLETLKEMVDGRIAELEKADVFDRGEITTAFYIGKMKEYELRDAADASIIFASYAMAEEGLDIVDLNTLIFATSKTSITQSVGRILRKQLEEGEDPPMVVDFADELSVFRRHMSVRRKFYQKQKYLVDDYPVIEDRVISRKTELMHEMNKTAEQIERMHGDFEELDTETELATILTDFGEKVDDCTAST